MTYRTIGAISGHFPKRAKTIVKPRPKQLTDEQTETIKAWVEELSAKGFTRGQMQVSLAGWIDHKYGDPTRVANWFHLLPAA